MITIAFVEPTSDMAGVEYSTLFLAEALDKTQYTPVVIVPTWGPMADACQTRGIAVRVVPRAPFRSASFRWGQRNLADPLAMLFNPWQLWRSAYHLQKNLHHLPVDLLVSKGLLVHFYGGWAARRLGIPCIWHVQDEVPERRAGGLYLRGLQMAAQHLAQAVIGDAQTIARQFPRHPTVSTIYNGIDIQAYAPTTAPGNLRHTLGIPGEATLIGNLARLTDWKGQHVLIEAFQQIAPEHPQAHLVLIGTPLFDNNRYEQRLHRLVQEGPASDRIHFAGYRTDPAQTLAALDIYVHPSVRKDTAPLALLSALATGLPVVISDVPGMVEVVEPDHSALVFPAEDSAALVQHLRRLLTQPELGRCLGQAARDTAVQRFSLHAHAEAMIDIFNQTLNQ
ncbi:MAG: glycosyltransferase family 4 protein [Chitinophagaceae bacterium]